MKQCQRCLAWPGTHQVQARRRSIYGKLIKTEPQAICSTCVLALVAQYGLMNHEFGPSYFVENLHADGLAEAFSCE